MPQPKERDVQRLILDWLAVKGVWFVRLNAGAFAGEYKGRKRFVRFGKPGMADVMVRVRSCGCHGILKMDDPDGCPIVRDRISTGWIEVKAEKGRQSPEQKAFELEVNTAGMFYVLARSLEDVERALNQL